MTITQDQLLLVGAVILTLCGLCFAAGYQAADRRALRISKNLASQLRLAREQRRLMREWIEKNWATEHAAFNSGIDEGYQQGLLHSHILEEDAP